MDGSQARHENQTEFCVVTLDVIHRIKPWPIKRSTLCYIPNNTDFSCTLCSKHLGVAAIMGCRFPSQLQRGAFANHHDIRGLLFIFDVKNILESRDM